MPGETKTQGKASFSNFTIGHNNVNSNNRPEQCKPQQPEAHPPQAPPPPPVAHYAEYSSYTAAYP